MKKSFKFKIVYSALFFLSLSSVVSCGPQEPEFIDFASTSDVVKLGLEYEGRDFFKDGIAEVELYTAIDGDTAHFKMTEGNDELIKSRFYGLDTPESTGKVQEYGKAASNFTKEKLQKANESGTIVVSSPFFYYGVPQTDSTGGRYLSLIWINEEKEHAPISELKCLNLMIVQEGYSWVKNLNEIPEYVDVFTEAEQQARDLKLNLFSGEPDPLFNYGDYVDVSLLDLKKEIIKSLDDPNYENPYDNANIRIQGTIVGYTDRIIYLQTYFDEETGSTNPNGEYAGINIFAGMGSIPAKFTTRNNFIEVSGVFQDSENFGFQVTDVELPRVDLGNPNAGKVLFTADEIEDSLKVHSFEFKPSELKAQNYDCLFSPITFTESVYVTGGYDGEDSITLYLEDEDGNELDYSCYIPFLYRPDLEDSTVSYRSYEDFVGKEFSVSNCIYSFHKTRAGKYNYQIIPTTSTDFALVA